MTLYAGDTLNQYARGEAQLGGKSSVEGVRDDMARKFNTMVEAMPPDVRARVEIHSGFRSPERNVEVYRQYGERPSNIPGTRTASRWIWATIRSCRTG